MEYSQGKLTAVIIQSIIKVHQTLGPGFLESIYREALLRELSHRRLQVEKEKKIKVYYEGEEVGEHRLDIPHIPPIPTSPFLHQREENR
jgi:GxxExxY protein